MKKLGIALVLAGIVGCSVGPSEDQGSVAPPLPQLQGKTLNYAPAGARSGAKDYVVVYRSESIPADAASKIAKAGGKLVSTLPSLGIALVEGPDGFDAKISKDANVLSAGHEQRMHLPASHGAPTADPPIDQAWFLQWDMRRINAPAAWEHVPSLGNTTVAVIDTGVMSDHPELAGQVVFSKTYSHCTMPEDGAGYPAYTPFILIDDVPNRFPIDCYIGLPTNFQDHGTHVAGTIGGNKDFAVTVGVAPGVKLLSYKVFERLIFLHEDFSFTEDYGADDYNIWAAIDDASSKGVSVINMSLGGTVDRKTRDGNTHYLAWDRVVRTATKRGTLVVAASGNDNANSNGTTAFLPSDLSSVLSVGATGTTTVIGAQGFDAQPGSDVRTEYSNYGASVDITAPGGDCGPGGFTPNCNPFNLILSSVIVPLGVDGLAPGSANWAFLAGTSMASPHVAGVAALVKAKHPEFTPAMIKDRLKSTAQQVGPRLQFGAGIVDAAAATSL